MDYFAWSVTEWGVNRAPHNTKTSLMAYIMEVFTILLREDIRRACSRFRSWLEEVVIADEDFMH